MKEKIIAIDIDDVLAKTLPALVEYYNDTYGGNYVSEDFKHDRWYKTWGGDAQEEYEKVLDFYQSEYFLNIKPFEHSQKVVKELSQYAKLFVVTARGEHIAEVTKNWLSSYFPSCFSSVNFANHYSEVGIPVPKSKICTQLGADFLIDDSFEYAKDCLSSSREILLMDHPANREATLSEGMTRVRSWLEIRDFFEKKFVIE